MSTLEKPKDIKGLKEAVLSIYPMSPVRTQLFQQVVDQMDDRQKSNFTMLMAAAFKIFTTPTFNENKSKLPQEDIDFIKSMIVPFEEIDQILTLLDGMYQEDRNKYDECIATLKHSYKQSQEVMQKIMKKMPTRRNG